MKITFINPTVGGIIGLNLGLAYVISSAERVHQVRLLDLTFHQNDYLPYVQNVLAQDTPDVIGFSVTTFNFKSSLEIAQVIRQAYPGIPFLFGGVHPTLLPDETIQHPLVDAICIGEGETAILEYLQKLEKGETPDVPGIWYKDTGGTVHKNPLRPFHQDIDALPFPNFDHWPVDNYLNREIFSFPGTLHLLSSRGCPYTCSFCSNEAIQKAVPGTYYRCRKPEKIIQEIKEKKDKYQKNGFRSISFGDEIFGLDIGRLRDFCELYKKEKLPDELKWNCATRANLITPEWAQMVADAGCIVVNLGIESGDDYIRNQVYKKNISREEIRRAVSILRDNHVAYGFLMMVGCPQDTRDTINASRKMVAELDPIKAYFSFFQPLPKTELATRMDPALWEVDRDFAEHGGIPRIRTQSLSIRKLRAIMWQIHLPEMFRFMKQGFKMRKAAFLLDIVRFIFSIGVSRNTSLLDLRAKFELEQKTVYRYLLDGKSPL